MEDLQQEQQQDPAPRKKKAHTHTQRERFGVFIPPWDSVKAPVEKCLTMEFVLTGTIPSKKNMQTPAFNRPHVMKQIDTFYKTTPVITNEAFKAFNIDLFKKMKLYIRHPEKYLKWEAEAKEKISTQVLLWKYAFEHHGLSFPVHECSISIKHYWSDKLRRDNSNKAETIHDLLVSCGIIVDDTYTCLRKNVSESKHFKDLDDHITVISVTAYRW